MAIYYRPLDEPDFSAFVAIRKEAFLNEPTAFGSDYASYNATPLLDKEHFFEKVLNYPFSFVLGAFDGDTNAGSAQSAQTSQASRSKDELVGMAGFSCHQASKRRHKGVLWGMYVKPSYRHQGIARSLADIVMRSAKEDAYCEQVLITVSPPNSSAHHFYEELGFVLYGVEYRALKLENEYVDEVLMMKVL
jgi:ribosomal protein S18 acetylase RimI-like enzyme